MFFSAVSKPLENADWTARCSDDVPCPYRELEGDTDQVSVGLDGVLYVCVYSLDVGQIRTSLTFPKLDLNYRKALALSPVIYYIDAEIVRLRRFCKNSTNSLRRTSPSDQSKKLRGIALAHL